MRAYRFNRCVVSFWLIVSSFSLSYAIPQSLTYQGSLKQNGVVVNGTQSMIFNITNADGSQLYWTSGPMAVPVQEGLYRVELTPTVNWATIDPYIETRIAGSVLLPREKLATTPYAVVANTALMAKDLVRGPGGTYTFGGDVGIGAAPLTKLHVEGIAPFVRIKDNSVPVTNSGLQFFMGSANRFNIYSNGPEATLDINSNTAADGWGVRIRTTPTGGVLTTAVSVNGKGQTQIADGTLAAPSLTFLSDPHTGIYKLTTNTIGFVSNGADVVYMNYLRMAPNSDNVIQLGTNGSRWKEIWAANGVIQTSASSNKRDIQEILPTGRGFALNPIAKAAAFASAGSIARPNEFAVPRGILFKWEKNQGKPNDKDVLGFMGDDLPEEAHALREDGSRDPDNFYTSSVIGLLCAKVRAQDDTIKNLTARVAALEANH